MLRFGLNLMLYYFECESESEPSPRDNPSPPPGLSLADVQELSQVRTLNYAALVLSVMV